MEINFVSTCEIIEKWIASATTFEQLYLLINIVDVFISPVRFQDENVIILVGEKSILIDKITYQREILQANENRKSIVSKDI